MKFLCLVCVLGLSYFCNAADNLYAGLMPPVPKVTKIKKLPPPAPVQAVKISWLTNQTAEYYKVLGSSDLTAWKPIGFATNINTFTYQVTNSPTQFFKVYGEADDHSLGWITLGFTYSDASWVNEFAVYYGNQSGQYTQTNTFARSPLDATLYTATITNLQRNLTYFFRVIAISVDGQESDFSQDEVVYTVPPVTTTFYQQMPSAILALKSVDTQLKHK